MKYNPSYLAILGATTIVSVRAVPMDVPTSTQLLLNNPPKMNLKSCVTKPDTELHCIKHKTIRHPSYDFPAMENHPPQDEGSVQGDATYKNIESERACQNLCYAWNHKKENFNNKCYGFSYIFNTVEAVKAGKAKTCSLKKSFEGCGTRAIDEQYTKNVPYLVVSGQVRCGKVDPSPDPSVDTQEEIPEEDVEDNGNYGDDVQIDDFPEIIDADEEERKRLEEEEKKRLEEEEKKRQEEAGANNGDETTEDDGTTQDDTTEEDGTGEQDGTTEDDSTNEENLPTEEEERQHQRDEQRKEEMRNENPDIPAEIFDKLVPVQDDWLPGCEAAILLTPEQMQCTDYKYIDHRKFDWPRWDYGSPTGRTLEGATYDNILTFEECKELCTRWSNDPSKGLCYGVAYVPDTPEGQRARKQNTCWLKTRFMDCGRPAADATTEVRYRVDSAQALCY